MPESAGDINSATARLAAMAETAMGGTMARDLLATGLRYAIHQELVFDPRETGWRRGKIGGAILASLSNNSQAATLIREGKFTNLNQPIEQQAAQMRMARSVEDYISKLDINRK